MKNSKRLLALAVSAAIAAPMAAHATNGMNLEGYGPIATGMGGASMAYDNGTAGMMNNPATLGLADDGNRLDVAVGHLGIDITVDGPAGSGMSWDSDATGYDMPAIGWVQNSGAMTYGVGVFAQGGMGTEYNAGAMGSPGGAFSAQATANNIVGLNQTAGAFGLTHNVDPSVTSAGNVAMTLDEMSEVSVGRLIFPFNYQVNKTVNLGASVDYVWAAMDLKMAMPGDMMADMMMGSQAAGSISGGLVNAMGGMFLDPSCLLAGTCTSTSGISGLNYGYFDFADDSPYTGEATGSGFAGKLGVTFTMSPQVSVGMTYHSKTSLSDLEASGANLSMSVLQSSIDALTGQMNTMAADMVMKGTVKVKDFQWPSTFAVGAAFTPNDKLLIAADFKRINWSEVMSDFSMSFVADSITLGGVDMTAMLPKDMEMSLKQDWKDQVVVSLGATYQATNALAVRAGINQSSNPIPDNTVNYLFPATIENHYTAGVGYAFSQASSVDFALSYAPEVKVDMGNTGAQISHSQTNWQLMYSHKF